MGPSERSATLRPVFFVWRVSLSSRPGPPRRSNHEAEGHRRLLGRAWFWLGLLGVAWAVVVTLQTRPNSLAARASDVAAKRAGTHRVLLLGRPSDALQVLDSELRGRRSPTGAAVEVVDLRDDHASLADGLSLLEGLGTQLLPDAVRFDLLVTRHLDPAWESQLQALASAARDKNTSANGTASGETQLAGTAHRFAERCRQLRARCVVVVMEREGAHAEPRQGDLVETASLQRDGLTWLDLRAGDDDALRATVSAVTDALFRPLSSSDRGKRPDSATVTPLQKEPGGAALSSSTEVTPLEERARLRTKLSELQTLRDEMKGVITELTQQRQVAEDLEARLGRLQRGMEPSAVTALLAEADRSFSVEASGPGGLLDTAKRIDRDRERLLAPERPLAEDDDDLRSLKHELATQQEATRSLGASTAVAFRALRTLGQLRHAIRLLETRRP